MKRIKRFFTKRRILVLSLCLVVFVMSLGYAALTQYVELDGIASIDRSWIVKVTKVTNTVTNSATSISSNYVSNTVTLNANLPTSSSTITYTITLSNQGNIPAKLNDIEIIEDENSNITYEISGVEEEVTTLAPGETNTAKVTIKYKSGVTNISETKKELMLTFIYVENSGTTGGNSGDSTSDTENVVYQLGDTIALSDNQYSSLGRIFYTIETNDTISSNTIDVITDFISRHSNTVSEIMNSDIEVSLGYTIPTPPPGMDITILTASNSRLPTMEEIGNLLGFKYDSNKNYDGEVIKISGEQSLTNSKKMLTSTTRDGKYYAYTINETQVKIELVDTTESISLRAVTTLNKEELSKYLRYEVGDSVELIDGSKWYVTKDSGTGNAMVTLISENGASSNGSVLTYGTYSRGFDTSGSNTYNQFSSTNIGYFVKNTVESYIKNAIKSNGGNEASTTARLLSKGEYDKITKNGSNIPSWLKIPGPFWMMTNTGSNVYYFNGSSLSQATPTSYYRVRPVITTLKSNLKPTVYLKDQILEDNNEQSDSNIDFSQISSSTNGQGLYYTNTNTEGNKTTYYFRGAVENNYVEFAGLYWRIIRINEDGSIRLIYQGETPTATGEATAIGNGVFNQEANDNAYVGYMYGQIGSSSYATTHTNTTSSVVKKELEQWYEENLLDYASYLADAGFCGDRSIYSGLGYSSQVTTYAPSNRVTTTYQPQFSCPRSNDLYTTSSSSKGNKALFYPIGLITADEIMYAGGGMSSNTTYYLYTGSYYWTISPVSFGGTYTYVDRVAAGGYLSGDRVTNSYGIRPVINLESDVTITGGSGTSSNPYVIKTT